MPPRVLCVAAMRFGIHAGPQDCTLADLQRLWRIADRHFDWCSVWDHLYSVSDLGNPAQPAFEGVSIMTALAAATTSVEVGCLVFCAGYRNPGVLAKAAVTIDHVSGGRCVLGIGAGWNQAEFDAFGMPFEPIGTRLAHLEETALALRRLFDGETVTLEGTRVTMRGAVCSPRPVQARLPIWIGGAGEKRMLRIVAEHADGWNVPFMALEDWARKNRVLDRWCERVGRDPRAIRRTVNVGLAIGATEARAAAQAAQLHRMFGALTDYVKPGHLLGTPAAVRDRLGAYADAGVEQVILAVRAPFDWEGIELFVEEVLPAFR